MSAKVSHMCRNRPWIITHVSSPTRVCNTCERCEVLICQFMGSENRNPKRSVTRVKLPRQYWRQVAPSDFTGPKLAVHARAELISYSEHDWQSLSWNIFPSCHQERIGLTLLSWPKCIVPSYFPVVHLTQILSYSPLIDNRYLQIEMFSCMYIFFRLRLAENRFYSPDTF